MGLTKRELKQRQQQVEELAGQAESLAERHFFKRLDRLVPVRRFVVSWMLFFVLLCGCLVGQIRALNGHFQSLQPIPGGVYTEGILGDFTTANPLYASSEVDESVSRLLFSGLFTYDEHNKLVGDLAESVSVDPTERVYTVTLRPHLLWHDGAPLTAQDVLFTYQTIQNPDAGSYLQPSWKDVKVAAPNSSTVVFTLPNALSSFMYHMTTGIIPEHLLKDVDPAEMRSVTFNTLNPVGSGPFMWQKVEVSGDTPETREEQIALSPFKYYHAGAPKLASFIVHAFHDENQLVASFSKHELTAASFADMPSGLQHNNDIQVNNYILTAANMVFFKETNPVLSDVNVRKALVQAANTAAIVKSLPFPTHPVISPLLEGQLGFDRTVTQLPFDVAAANAALTADGWLPSASGVRMKGKQPLTFTLQAQDTAENRKVTSQLQDQWRQIGVRADVQLREGSDLQAAISSQNYDALLYGISIGPDPDVFVYWDSSQKDPRSTRLNFSMYGNKVSDTALEGGRTRQDPALRAIKYKPFLQAWQQDAPALGLYQPRFMYLTYGVVYGLDPHTINSDSDRFNNVQNWEIRQASMQQVQ